MLDFLGNIGSSMSQAAPAMNGISGILGLISGIKGENDVYKAYKNQGPTASEAQSTQLLNALLDPENPMVKRLSQEDLSQSAAQFLSRIRGMQLADRRRQGRGGQPTFFAPERADEAVDFLTSRALPQLQASGMDTARSRIANVAQGLRGNIPAEQQRQQEALRALQTHTANRGNVLSSIPQIFSQIQGMLGSQQPQGQDDWMDGAIYDY